MGDSIERDFISDLPQAIIESILGQLPFKDAVKTSVLSSRWRFQWALLPKLIFDDSCVSKKGGNLVKFISQALLLHQGPIQEFKLSSSGLQACPEIDQWLLVLSRSDIQVLILELAEDSWLRIPGSLFNCKYLTHLEITRCELDPPPTFEGFACLRKMELNQVSVSSMALKSLISGSQNLENLSLSYCDCVAIEIDAPNLQFLWLEGEFRDISLSNTPRLVGASIAMYMTDDRIDLLEQRSTSNFVNILGGVPNLERLVGHIYFTKYLSAGGLRPALTFKSLKVMELYQVNFDDVREIIVLLGLITKSPNLKELRVSGSSNALAELEAADLNFWVKEWPKDFTFSNLKAVTMTCISGAPHEMQFIKLLLANSPLLQTMTISPCVFVLDGTSNMLIELLRFRRASPQAEVLFIDE